MIRTLVRILLYVVLIVLIGIIATATALLYGWLA